MANPTGAEIVADTTRYLGIPYVFGGGPANPRAGLDCSGLVVRVADDLGIQGCPRTSEEQKLWAEAIPDWEVGCLVFFEGSDGEPGSPGHVGIVTSAGMMINAPFTGTVVRYDAFGTNGTGVNLFEGYGRMRGATPGASSANQNLVGNADVANNKAAAIGGAAGGLLGAGIFAVAVLLLLAGIALAIFLLSKG